MHCQQICNKNAALKAAESHIVENLVVFRRTSINVDMIIVSEKFLVRHIDGKQNYNEFRMEFYHPHNFMFNLEKISPNFPRMQKHIQSIFGIILVFQQSTA